MSEKEKLLEKYYNDPKTGLGGVDKLYHRLKSHGITHKDIDTFIKKQEAYQVHHEVKKATHIPILSRRIHHNFQIDLMDMSKLKRIKGNKGYAWILSVIDVYSRRAWAFPLKHKTPKEVTEAFKKIGIFPRNMNHDEGNEFKGEFRKLMQRHNVKLWVSDPDESNKNAIVERFHRTLRNLLKKWYVISKKYVWVSVLNDILENYNNSYHRTLKGTPMEVYGGKKKSPISLEFYVSDSKIKVGDKVRIKLKRSVFDKGDELKWSKRVYKVMEKEGFSFRVNGRKYKPNELLVVPSGTEPPLGGSIIKDLSAETEPSGSISDEKEKQTKIIQSQRRLRKTGVGDEPLKSMRLRKRDYGMLVGAEVRKKFGNQWFDGEVIKYDDSYFRVKYSDGDKEDMTYSELRKWLK